ncbi:hypothetical protein Ddc_13690 [Ditylenchus destructor]|nr:hypothetical protein Ddc_13690 [Ditylenchus destructor]
MNNPKPTDATRQEEKNRKLLDDLNKKRQNIMMKNANNRSAEATNKDLNRPLAMTSMDMQTSITFLPNNSPYGNTILPIIPRIPPDSIDKNEGK